MMKFAFPFALVIASFSTPVVAGSHLTEIHVTTADLDLTSPKGRSYLQARLKSAIRKACAPERTAGIHGQSKFRACVALKTVEANKDRDEIYASIAVDRKVASLR